MARRAAPRDAPLRASMVALSRVVSRAVVPPSEVDAWLRPRRQVVIEDDGDDGTFVAHAGGMARYSRTVDAEPAADGMVAVTQRVDFQLAVPYFGFLFVPLVKRHLGRPESERPP